MDLRASDFVQLVKRTREKFAVDIVEAHDIIFAEEEEVRRLVAWRINHDPACRKMASQDIARNGAQSRFARIGDRIVFRRKDGQRIV